MIERYKVEVEGTLEGLLEQILTSKIDRGQIIDEALMRDAPFSGPDKVSALWKEKARIDSFFDDGKEACYYRARNTVFPQDQKGSEKFRNRAGDKLWEVHQGKHNVVSFSFLVSLFFVFKRARPVSSRWRSVF